MFSSFVSCPFVSLKMTEDTESHHRLPEPKWTLKGMLQLQKRIHPSPV